MAQLRSVDLSASNAHNISAREQNVYTLRDVRRERMLAMSEGASVSAVTVSRLRPSSCRRSCSQTYSASRYLVRTMLPTLVLMPLLALLTEVTDGEALPDADAELCRSRRNFAAIMSAVVLLGLQRAASRSIPTSISAKWFHHVEKTKKKQETTYALEKTLLSVKIDGKRRVITKAEFEGIERISTHIVCMRVCWISKRKRT